MKDLVEITDLAKLEIKVGTIIDCANVVGSEKLLRLTVDIGGGELRNIFSGIAKFYKPEELKGVQTIFLVNIKPRKMMGEESQGMLMAIDAPEGVGDGKPVLLKPSNDSENGWTVI